MYDELLRDVDSAFVVLNGKMKAVKAAVVSRLKLYMLCILLNACIYMCPRHRQRKPNRRPRAGLARAADQQVSLPAPGCF